MRPVNSFLRARGHRVSYYLDDFFVAKETARNDHPATKEDTGRAGRDIKVLLSRLGLTLHPTKTLSEDSSTLEIFGIIVDTRRGSYIYREAARTRECCAGPIRACLSESTTCPHALPQEYLRPLKHHWNRCRRRYLASESS
jgi:hypothetical protein